MISERTRQRAERIHEEIDIAQVLADLGYHVRDDADHREQQFPCDLHGDGMDDKPSARVYPETASWYCFACAKSRDAIDTYREKFDLTFSQACKQLEEKYGLPPLPWKEEDNSIDPNEVVAASHYRQTFEKASQRVEALLLNQREDKTLPVEDILAFWEAYDLVEWKTVGKKNPNPWPEKQGITAMLRLRDRILNRIRQVIRETEAPGNPVP